MVVLVCGSREWSDVETMEARLSLLPQGTEIIHGGCCGADVLASVLATRFGFKTRAFPADWGKYGRSAGPIRNRQMLDERPSLVLAFHRNLSRSMGTADTVREARRRGIPVEVIS
jgi:hypothetical protein